MWANSWQVAVSLLYVRYNALVTTCLVGEEWSRFACSSPTPGTIRDKEAGGKWTSYLGSLQRPVARRSRRVGPPSRVKKALRVSAPEGIQRSSYFVSMPWRYGIPLIAGTSILHWLISQSLFVIIAQSYQADGKVLDHGIVYINGFSIQAILTSKYSEALQTHALRLSSNNDRPRVCCVFGTAGNAQISRRCANGLVL